MKKILYITQYFPPEIGAGAVRSSSMARYLAGEGWDVHVLCENPNYPLGISMEAEDENEIPNLRISRVPLIITKRQNLFQQIVFFLSFMISAFGHFILNPEKYDIIYVSSPPIFAGLSGALISKICRSYFVFEVRDLWPDSAINEETIRNESWFARIGHVLEKWLYRQADLVIPVTETSEAIIKDKEPSVLTRIVTNGVETELFSKKEDPLKSIDEDLDPDKFIVGFVGSMGMIHDLDTLLAAARLCEDDPDIQFLIVGDSGRIHSLMSVRDHASNNLIWVGLKKHEQIPYYISLFDVGLNPVKGLKVFESIITVKFFEYLSCGVPVINGAKGELERIGQQSQASVTITPEDPVLLAETIKRLKSKPEQLAELAGHARPFILNNYQRRAKAEQLSLLLAELTSSNSTHHG